MGEDNYSKSNRSGKKNKIVVFEALMQNGLSGGWYRALWFLCLLCDLLSFLRAPNLGIWSRKENECLINTECI